ncbi:uncharacterized protein LOC126897572 [Daktulosphaira vitifoliae]|uniref:uncharacterized protein LOC126897572 n=1 Tax=Daktulosphaira vitifoliae TaxID=58002 RepID=UPI0021AA800A|nr:uncharacterized protein LOC126897572 [Daktulosphaira vitifoliae]
MSVIRLSLFCAAFGLVIAVPMHQETTPAESSPSQIEDSLLGFGKVLWSVVDDCFGGVSSERPTVCLKSRALIALDRALSKPTVNIMEGVALTARTAKSVVDNSSENNDRVILESTKDVDQKDALLDDMIANRVDKLMATRTIVLDGLLGQEGRKKKDKGMQQAMMMAGMMAAAIMGPMAFKMVALMAGKALLISKIALVLSGIIALKKLLQPQQGGESHESVSHHYGRSLEVDSAAAQNMAYSAQKQ